MLPPEGVVQADQRTHVEILESLDKNPVDTLEAQDLWLTDFQILYQKKVGETPALEISNKASEVVSVRND